MAARRLIIVLLVLFAFSIAAAMIAPERRGGLIGGSSSNSESTTSTTTSTTSTGATTTTAELPAGKAITERIDASARDPETVKAVVGDQLELVVASERARAIEVPAFGVTETAAPDAPAGFNLLLRDSGRLAILDADSGELLGRLDVREPATRDEAEGQRRPAK
ncbi:MAG TPA: hypothetical protein VJS87_03860 [Solirubrobacterales bacterium]|nr:hypothetical protein [Solirubrobacterales bacterium]